MPYTIAMVHNLATKICVPVWNTSQLGRIGRGADLIEIRADKMPVDRVESLMRQCKVPVILTLRGQQGRIHDLEQLAALEPDYLDLEIDIIAQARHHVRGKTKIICSHHDFRGTPEDLDGEVDRLKREPADLYKLACSAHSTLDSLRMLHAMQEHPGLIGLCMGQDGLLTRIAGPIFGAPIAFAALGEGEASAPGQLDLQELLEIYHVRSIGPSTKLLGLIADPFPSSFGYLVHNRAFRAAGMDGVYLSMRVRKEELGAFFELVRKLPFLGLSVTMPLKEAVVSHLDQIEPDAAAMGAVNTIVLQGGKLIGSNQDAAGALDAIEACEKVTGKRLTVIGAGGAARAVAYEAIKRGADVKIVNRTAEKATSLAGELGCEGGGFELLDTNYEIMVQCTSVGMSPHEEAIPIGEDKLRRGSLVMDIVARPPITRLLQLARGKGCRTIGGRKMWINQALRQLRCWFGDAIDLEHVKEGLDDYIASIA